MTPEEQSRLPLTVCTGTDDAEPVRHGLLRTLLPVLERRLDEPTHLRAWCERPADDRGRRIRYRSVERLDGIHTTVSITVAVAEPSNIVIDGTEGRFSGIIVARALLELVRRLADAPTAPGDHPASWDRVGLSGLRMRERRGAPLTGNEVVDVHHATPLGLGGAVVDDGIRYPSIGGAMIGGVLVPGEDVHGRIVDLSPDLCVPGPVRIAYRDAVTRTTQERSVSLVVGHPARSQALKPLDPILRMRLEAEHPWDPGAIRWITPPLPRGFRPQGPRP